MHVHCAFLQLQLYPLHTPRTPDPQYLPRQFPAFHPSEIATSQSPAADSATTFPEFPQMELDHGQRMGKAVIALEGPESAVGIRGLMEQTDRAQIEPVARQALPGAAIVALGLMRLRADRGGSGLQWLVRTATGTPLRSVGRAGDLGQMAREQGGFAAEVEFKGHFDGDGIDAPAAGDGAGFEGGAGEAGSWISEMRAMARPMA
jgi:hypothetical protein